MGKVSGNKKRLSNKTILNALKNLGFKYVNMNMRQAATVVASAYGIEYTDSDSKVVLAEAIRALDPTAVPVAVPAVIHTPEPPEPKPRKAPKAKSLQRNIDAFYASWEWKRLRYDFLKAKARTCQCCAATAESSVRIVVDHIRPIRKNWELRLDINNLQLLCDDCNMGKGSRDETDWRQSSALTDVRH